MPEARAFLRDLTEHATQPQFVYRHVWRVGDLVIWDNRATQHYAVMDYPPSHLRMERATVIGDRPF